MDKTLKIKQNFKTKECMNTHFISCKSDDTIMSFNLWKPALYTQRNTRVKKVNDILKLSGQFCKSGHMYTSMKLIKITSSLAPLGLPQLQQFSRALV